MYKNTPLNFTFVALVELLGIRGNSIKLARYNDNYHNYQQLANHVKAA